MHSYSQEESKMRERLNSAARMIEIYKENIAGYDHEYRDVLGNWNFAGQEFYIDYEYRKISKPDMLEEFIAKRLKDIDVVWKEDMIAMAEWAWANPRSEE